MRTCYFHPRIEAIAQCRSCKLPSCFHCLEDQYCPECVKLRRYIELGYSGPRRPRLVETPPVRSRTMELMIQRLQVHAVDADAASLRGARRPEPKKPLKIKTRKRVGYGLLLPGLAPMIKVTRSPLSQAAMVAMAVFGLSSFFAQPHRTMAEPIQAPVAEVQPVDTQPIDTREMPAMRVAPTSYQAAYVYVNQAPRPVSTPAPVSQTAIRYMPAVVDPAAWASDSMAPETAETTEAGEAAQATGEMTETVIALQAPEQP